MNFFQKNFSKNLFFLLAVLKAKAGAKISHLFETTKYFGNFFQKYFSKNLCALKSYAVSLDCGCKGSAYFLLSKLFSNFFQLFFSTNIQPYNISVSYATTIFYYHYPTISISAVMSIHDGYNLGKIEIVTEASQYIIYIGIALGQLIWRGNNTIRSTQNHTASLW